MCGRFSLAQNGPKITRHFKLNGTLDLEPRYNIYPGQSILMVHLNESHQRIPVLAHWGLIPPWVKEEDIGTKWINARSETVMEKKLFKNSFQHKRCLIIADGFYEWTPTKIKTPYYFHLQNHEPFGFAGIWERWESKTGRIIESCCILTAEANKTVQSVHNRMPIIVPKELYSNWLNTEKIDTSTLNEWIYSESVNPPLIKHSVSTYVNNPVHEGEKCIEKIVEEQ